MIDYPPPEQEIVAAVNVEQTQDATFPLKGIYADRAMNFFEPTKSKRSSMSTEQVQLLLYIRPTCPYCRKVTKALKKMGKTVPEVNVSVNAEALEELIRVGGKKQVPCLFINGKAHYESDWIINWLKDNKKLLKDA